MWCFVIIVCFTSWAAAQNGRGPQHLDHNGHGWDIRLAVPGNPGNDYPTLGNIPRTTFSCAGREPGYYADRETNCQVFKVCTVGSTYGFQSFLCPNGTLFNQAVFVCDWWMNVKCENSEQLVRNNNEQFENLRLGPQLMKDIKKMLTHPMRNPYDRTVMKSNLIVMQDYKPPAGQIFPNGALIAGPERAPNNIYIPKPNLIQNIYADNNGYNSFPSTPDPKYAPAAFTTIRPTTYRDVDFYQRQRQYDINNNNLQQGIQNSPPGNIISNGHAGQFTSYQNTAFTNNNGYSQLRKPKQNNYQSNSQYTLNQMHNSEATQNRGQLNRQRALFVEDRNLSQFNSGKQTEFTNSTHKQQNSYNNIQDNTPLTNISTPYQNRLPETVQNEVKQDVVSTIKAEPSTVVTKTVTYSRYIQTPKAGKPKSRITVKTWLVKPTKSARLLASPTSYTYNKPTQPTLDNLVDEVTPYVYNKPTTQSQTERIITEPNPTPYTYNKPTTSVIQTSTEPQLNVSPTPITINKSRQTLSSRLVAPTTSTTRIYSVPTTVKPSARLYLPPSEDPLPSRQYLSPIILPPVYYPSAQLRAKPTIDSPSFITTNPIITSSSFTTPKQAANNFNRYNVTFADILTKEKLDSSVNNIVKDTDNILKTASPPKFGQYRDKSIDYPEDYYLPTNSVIDSGEKLTSQYPSTVSISSRIIAHPTTKLEPPTESYNSPIKNPLSNLPYFKESLLPPTNTIERTVSLKITIPEKLAAYLFSNSNQSDFDKLEVYNTGSSHYLVLSNNMATAGPSFIPIGKLVGDNNSNISNSQALVFSLLADSINMAKKHSNTARQEVLSSTPATTQFQNVNNEELAQISNKISQLTSTQYFGNNHNTNGNVGPSAQTSDTTQGDPFSAKYTNNYKNLAPQLQTTQFNLTPQQLQGPYYSSQYQGNPDLSSNLLSNDNNNQIYSGQLYQFPVPDVTNQIYNRPFTTNQVQPINIPQLNAQTSNDPSLSSQNNNVSNNLVKQSEPTFEIMQSQTLPFNLQSRTSNEPKSFSQERLNSLLNSDNGISAQLQDTIIGTIPHPLEDNKVVTYEKDQSYYFTTNLDKTPSLSNSNVASKQNANIPQSNGNIFTFQFIPSVGYELEDEAEQQQFLDAFRIDEFGAPRDVKTNLKQRNNQEQNDLTSIVNNSVEESTSAKQQEGSNMNSLYAGHSSYLAPQSSIGSLRTRQENIQNNLNSRLEQLDEGTGDGYPSTRPARQFTF